MKGKESKISSLETQINIYSIFGWIFVTLALIPIGEVSYEVFIKKVPWPEADLGSFLGGVTGSFSALAGVFFVFVAFLGQRISIIQQQIEIQNNLLELSETRKEIRGQRQQLELQNEQFQIQSYETTFFNLLTHFRNSGPLDRLSKIYPLLKGKFDHLTKEFTQGPSADLIWHEKENAEEILKSKSSFTDVIWKLEDPDATDLYDSIYMLISIMNHITSHETIKNNHHSTLKNNLSHKEKFALFYFYVSTYNHFNINDQKLLYKFFSEIDSTVYYDNSHQLWVEDLPK